MRVAQRERSYRKILRNRQARIARRLAPRPWTDQPAPMLGGGNLHYEMGARTTATDAGGLGAIHVLGQRLGLVREIDARLHVLKVHLPYHESDHVLSVAYNLLAGGVTLQDLDLRRQDEALLDGLGAQRLPAPTTAGDFTRRFEPADILDLQEAINRARQRVWAQQPDDFLADALLDADGTLADTDAEHKAGINRSYKGGWSYGPLVLSLANTKEVLYLVNRPGNVPSHQGSVAWIDRALDLLRPVAGRITLRGDTDFTHTHHLDRWDGQGVKFVLGMDAHPNVVALAQGLPEGAWTRLERPPRYEVQTPPRKKRPNVKDALVKRKGYQRLVLAGEAVAELDYRPGACARAYRLVILRKEIRVERRGQVIDTLVRYFFYLTNRRDLRLPAVIELANGRCDQENVIAQLKHGIRALRLPVDDLESNWAYMVMAALAWNLKAWFALLVPDRARGLELLKMEFRAFLQAIIQLPCQVVRTGRQLVWRILRYNAWLSDFFATFQRIVLLSGP